MFLTLSKESTLWSEITFSQGQGGMYKPDGVETEPIRIKGGKGKRH